MTDVLQPPDPPPAGADPDPAPGPPARARSGFRSFVFLVLALVVGVGLRMAYAQHPGMAVGEWEADGFVITWEGRPWGALNRVRPAGLPLVLTQVGRALPVDGLLDVRWVSIGLSLLGLMAACVCAASLAAISGLKRHSMLRASAWITALWAVHPTLVMSAVSPTPELVMGLTACLLVAAFGFMRSSPGVLSWVSCTVAASAFLVAGGILAVPVLVIGVLVYLAPVPRAGRALAVLTALMLALGAGWFIQRGPDSERPWEPDTAWAYSVRALLGASGPHPNDIPTEVDLRARQTLTTAADALHAEEPTRVAQLWLGRLAFDLLGARRMEPLAVAIKPPGLEVPVVDEMGPPAVAAPGGNPDVTPVVDPGLTMGLGLFDLFLRGGLLLFAMAVIGLVKKDAAPSCWPRAGVVVAVLAWLLLLTAGAIGPVAVAPFDLLLLGVAGAGVAGADPRKAWTRRLAFAVGGVILASFLWTAGWRDEPLESWLTGVDHRTGEGRYLTSLLREGGPQDGEGLYSAANFMSLWKTPFLRLPEPAYAYAAEAWKKLLPTPRSDEAGEMLVRTLVECRRYADAARLAEDFHASFGTDDKRSQLLLHWVQDEQRKTENLPIRRP